jgi:NAD(P)-dependent dehydrogenase (short-subunit alcohol dehydrogenase family)
MQIDFTGKSAVVTGGASGIGRAISEGLRAARATVRVIDLTSDPPVNVADAAAVDRAFEDGAAPDVVVVNAGIGMQATLLETSDDLWQRTIATNLSGAFYTVRAAARRMLERGGAIVLTASTNSYDGEPNLTAYNASKAGLLGLVHTAANELGPYRIRVNAVCPGLIRTPLTERHFSNPSILKDYFRQIPLGRGGDASEVANAVLFLASDLASYITGATLFVDGGQMCSKFATWGDLPEAQFSGDHWTLLR